MAGLAEVAKASYPDPSQFEPDCRGYDPRSDPAAPRWVAVDIRLTEQFSHLVSLAEMRKTRGLEAMALLRRGNRLSVMPVSVREFRIIERLGRRVG